MNNMKWTWFAIGYQCGFAYVIALIINQIGGAVTGNLNVIGLIAALACLAGIIYMLFFKKYQEAVKLTRAVKVS
jgi:ferrous iron transport protein B